MSTISLDMLLGLPHLEVVFVGLNTILVVGEELLLSAAHRIVWWGHLTVR
jgi:hypothetical protein